VAKIPEIASEEKMICQLLRAFLPFVTYAAVQNWLMGHPWTTQGRQRHSKQKSQRWGCW